ncbi:FAD-dependent oxidoreductase [Mycobacterium yunnanensis]|uniref:FAD-dependent oxidoreductase n=2 Tax=Mycobacterium yunnanensis TaxID=368477 RepID=A0A9X2YJN9_9MYCO|nr:FAD-dependent oxidoreductase [Mycobacterium yunnanensis]
MARDGIVAPPTSSLDADLDVDVAIVGAGLTGLWTAWALHQLDPSTSVAVFDAHRIGYGASGRNCGWLSAKPVGVRRVLARAGGRESVVDVERALRRSMHDVVDVLGAKTIDARHGGALQVARSASQQRRLDDYVAYNRSWGVGEEQLRALSGEQAYQRVRVAGLTGAVHTPDNYCVDPVKMLFGLAQHVVDGGVAVYTDSPVDTVTAGMLRVRGYTVRVRRRVVVATEGYTASQPGYRRNLLPLNSSMLVTEPLSDEQWERVGWQHADGLSGSAHTYFYGQRTPDGRIALGGRGKPYRFGSAFDDDGRVDAHTVGQLLATLTELFPDVSLTAAHAWCGVLGVLRDWSPFVDADSQPGVIRVGGYAGQGLTAAHLAGHTVADLITGRQPTAAAWVRRMPRKWEPEPLRWIGANALYRTYTVADHLEGRSTHSRTSRLALAANAIAGR